jgi:2-oxoisovalerate dehydrogenase E2 component (dihydrolipoyl transacylase)
MGIHVIKLPDVGEGVAEAEFVELHAKVGDLVEPDQNLADVMTDKATVEIPSPRKGKVVWIGPQPGEVVPVGSEIIKLEVEGAGNAGAEAEAALEAPAEPAPQPREPEAVTTPKAAEDRSVAQTAAAAQHADRPHASNDDRPRARAEGEKPLASPAVRRRAQDRGVDLAMVHGMGPTGRITHEDLDAYMDGGAPARRSTGGSQYAPDASVTEVKVIGLRRKIAEKMAESKRRIPHITYVEEVDVTALEALRAHMNAEGKAEGLPKLTILPFLVRAIVRAVRRYPHVNARYDDEAGVVRQHGGVHLGIATQTESGLVVPVLRHAEALDLHATAEEIARLASAARDGTAKREELSGSTLTITSLGPLGGIVTTPVINHPEVAIVGVNKIQRLPRYDDHGALVPRQIMNLSSGFDHRIIDGWDAAEFVRAIKGSLEQPATLFL